MYSEEKTGFSFSEMILSVFSAIYGTLIMARDIFYLRGIFSRKRLPCRIISIGNITVGGTGKTPMTIYLAGMLTVLGYKVVVVSRGYRGRGEPKQRAHSQMLVAGLVSEFKTDSIPCGRRFPAACGGKLQKKGGIVSNGREILMGPGSSGDEPFMMAARLNNTPVVVGQNRYNAGLLAIRNFNPDIILLDDGFQHRKLFRDIDLLLLDSRRPFGNFHLIPRGVLREPAVSIKRADAFILTRSSSDNRGTRDTISAVSNSQPVFEAYNTFYFFKVKKGGVSNPASDFQNKLSEDFSYVAGKKVVAFSGIAGNSHFRKTLEEFKCDL
ncbi:MAG: tetraacyldisaccharide 4'-kinase, partial [Candidatus Firestonebacteria bacterium]